MSVFGSSRCAFVPADWASKNEQCNMFTVNGSNRDALPSFVSADQFGVDKTRSLARHLCWCSCVSRSCIGENRSLQSTEDNLSVLAKICTGAVRRRTCLHVASVTYAFAKSERTCVFCQVTIVSLWTFQVFRDRFATETPMTTSFLMMH